MSKVSSKVSHNVSPAAWHTLSSSDALALLRCDPQRGLTRREAARRLADAGPNKLERRKRPSLFGIFFSQFRDPTVLTLLAATVVSAVMKETVDAIVIAAIVVVNAVLGAVQEHRAETSLEALENYAPPTARLLRSGKVVEEPRESVVPGDVMVLEPGVRVPADGRVISSKALSIDEAALTGESLPRSKDGELSLPGPTSLSERKNMVYSGTLVTRGYGTAVAVATGMDTEMGEIARMVGAASPQPTPLEERLAALGKIILASCLGICGLLVVIGLWRGQPFHEVFLVGVSLAVAAVPEGLPAVVTLSFAFGVQRMARNGAIVRKLEAIETLGSITVICSDKTGTLTKNLMEVVSVAGPGDISPTGGHAGGRHVSGSGPRAEEGSLRQSGVAVGQIDIHGLNGQTGSTDMPGFGSSSRSVQRSAEHIEILRVALLASDARHAPGGRENAGEDPTEQAIAAAATDAGIDVASADDRFPRISEHPFTPERRMMSVAVEAPEGALICAKGASDAILPLCVREFAEGKTAILGEPRRRAWNEWVESQAQKGMRVLAVAQRVDGLSPGAAAEVGAGAEYKDEGLCLLGCLSMADPLREEAPEAVMRCRTAGIRAVLMTGDHLLTAESVAKEAGIIGPREKGMTGAQLEALGPAAARDAIANCSVFARVSPANKLQIVKALREMGHVVAMTGDGVNDAPALKEAAVGVAMGLTGTDVARGASSMILLDDNFSTIVKAVEEGRSIYENIRKFIRYLFSCNLGEVIVMMTAAAAGLPAPLTAAELLWMNLVTDGLPALALSRDPTAPDIMDRRPRDPKESLFAGGLWGRIVGRGLYVGIATLLVFMWSLRVSGLQTASTMAYATLVTIELVAAFDCRSEERSAARFGLFSNPLLVGACALSFAMLFATVQWPLVAPFFHTVPLMPDQWGMVFACSFFPNLFRLAFSRRK